MALERCSNTANAFRVPCVLQGLLSSPSKMDGDSGLEESNPLTPLRRRRPPSAQCPFHVAKIGEGDITRTNRCEDREAVVQRTAKKEPLKKEILCDRVR